MRIIHCDTGMRTLVSAYDAIRSNMPTDLRKEYYRHPEFRKKLNSVLRYAVRYGQSVIAYAKGRKKRCRMPKLEERKLDNIDLELLVGLHNAANLGRVWRLKTKRPMHNLSFPCFQQQESALVLLAPILARFF